MRAPTTVLKPRKSPIQARSVATVDTLHTAAIQVLIHEGLSRCTTTRVAERAGTSVGSLYQYYPNRDALLAAVLEKHLSGVAIAVENACAESHGKSIAVFVRALVIAYMTAKLTNVEASKALYAVAHEHGGAPLVARMRKRMIAAVADTLAACPELALEDPETTATFVLGGLYGPLQPLLDGHAPIRLARDYEAEIVFMLTAYLAGKRSRRRRG